MNQTEVDWIIWSDDQLVVLNKPAGLLVLPDGYDPTLPHVTCLLAAQFGRLWIVHRLDKDTSGLLLLARTAGAHRALNTAFETRQVTKAYHALVSGSPAWEEYETRQPLRVSGDRQHRTVVDARRGKPAITRLRVLERLGGYTLIEARPETGRTHQIRAHLAALGFPIIGDSLYGGQAISPSYASPWIERMALHAYSLEFQHPVSGVSLSFQAPYPDDYVGVLRLLWNKILSP